MVLVVTDMMVRDLIKLAATSISIGEICEGAPTPETAFVVVVRGANEVAVRGADFVRRLSARTAAELENMHGVPFDPGLALRGRSGMT